MAASRIGRKEATARRATAARPTRKPEPAWTFLTNHAHVLLCIAREPDVRMRDVAQLVGITERAVQRIVANLEEAGYIERIPHGRRNRYEVRTHLTLRHPIERHVRVSSLIEFVLGEHERDGRGRGSASAAGGGPVRAAPASAAVLAFNLVGAGRRDILDPRPADR